jgi:hypothetical protein
VGAREPLALPAGNEHLGAVDVVGWVCGDIVLDATVAPRGMLPRALVESFLRAHASGRAPAPTSLRVARPELATALRRELGATVTIEVAPTPEADRVFEDLARTLAGGEGPTRIELLELGERHPADVARFFAAAAEAYRAAPWDVLVTDDDVMMFDAPAVGLRRACVTVTGQLRENFAVIWIGSAEEYVKYRSALVYERVGIGDTGVAVRTVVYDQLAELPSDARKELLRRGWSIAGPAALPFPIHLDADGQNRPFTLDDVRAATVIFEALARFIRHHAEAVRSFKPCEGSYRVATERGEVPVTVRYPHPEETGPAEGDLDALEEPPGADLSMALFVTAWQSEFSAKFARELAAAREEMARAFLGRRPTRREEPAPLQCSLPAFWAAFWRPMVDGRTGLRAAAHEPAYTSGPLADGLARVEKARAVYAEAIEIDRARGTVTVRDLHDGARYEIVGAGEAQLDLYSRWMRSFGVIVPCDDGRWTFPSVFAGAPELQKVSHAELVKRVREALDALGKPARALDPASPAAGMLAQAGVVYAVLLRVAEEVRNAPPPKRFLENTDGDCVEFIDAEVELAKSPRAIEAAMRGARDFTENGPKTWDLLDRTRTNITPGGESLGQLAHDKRRWVARANSPKRLDALLDRLADLLGSYPVVRSRTIHAPWESTPGIVRTKAEAEQTMVIANGPVDARSALEADAQIETLVFDNMRRMLDQHVPMLGGVPRVVAKTEAGGAEVEAWLRGAEAHGLPQGGPHGRWLDLDPLREELGLSTAR